MRRSPPIVEAWLNDDIVEMGRIAEKARPEDPLSLQVRALWHATRMVEQVLPVEAYSQVCAALRSPTEEPELHRALIVSGVFLVRKAGEARRLLTLAQQLGGSDRDPRWKVYVLMAQTACLANVGEFSEARSVVDRMMAVKLPRGSALGREAKRWRFWIAYLMGQDDRAEEYLSDLERQGGGDAPHRVPLRLFACTYHLSQGRSEEGLAALGPPSRDLEASNHRPYLRHRRIRLLQQAGRLEEAQSLTTQMESDPDHYPRFLCEDLRMWEALARSDFPSAREFARRALYDSRHTEPRIRDTIIRSLIQVELASRQTRAAEALLSLLDREERNPDLCVARARLCFLKNDEAGAVSQFRRALAGFTVRQIQESLRYAYELTPIQLSRLWTTGAAGETSKISSKSKPASVLVEPNPLVGESPPIARLHEALRKIAPLKEPVLVTGETGTGKEVVARRLHVLGRNADAPFVAVNCAAVTDSLIEAELFGYVKGAFTGAERDRDGLFIAAANGTLFLDEIGAMSLRLQAALLRALESREIRPVGSTQERPFRARIVAATSASLEQSMERGEFRPDLYYRLNTLHLRLAPLRERPQDIPLLAAHFAREFLGDLEVVFSDDLLKALKGRPWAGNVRELRNEVQRLLILGSGSRVLTADLLGAEVRKVGRSSEDPAAPALEDPPAHRSMHARRQRLRTLFELHGDMTESEVVRLLRCVRTTARVDLKILEAEGFVRRVLSPSSGRTACFVRAK